MKEQFLQKQVTIEQKIEAIDRLIEATFKDPVELESWGEELEQAETLAELNSLHEKLKKLRSPENLEYPALAENNFVALAAEDSLALSKVQVLLDDIKSVLKDKDSKKKIDQGVTATVYQRISEDGEIPSYCLKVIRDCNLPDYKNYNSVGSEIKYQDELLKIKHPTVRVPRTIGFIENSGLHLMVMELLDADPLFIYTHSRSDDPRNIDLPENFDSKAFFAALKDFIGKMHERGIHHRDLHDGNILVDRKTMLPYVIDFGKSGRQYSDNDPYHEFDQSRNIKNDFPKDLDQIETYIKLIDQRMKGVKHD